MIVSELKEYIYNNQKIEFILDNIGCHNIKYHREKEYYSACQPDGDNPQGVNIKNNKYLNYRSYTRSVDYEDGKDIFDLIQYAKDISFAQAVKYTHQVLKLEFSRYDKSKKKTKDNNPLSKFTRHKCEIFDSRDVLEYIDEKMLDDYTTMPFVDWVKEGVMGRSWRKFGLVYSYKRKRIMIPLKDWSTGKLLGVNSRTVIKNYNEFGIKKYFITPTYKKHLNLFGLYENREAIENAGYIVIVEGEKSVLKRDSLQDSTLVALSGHTMSDAQVSIIKSLNINEVIIALDKDVPIQESRHICDKIARYKKVSYMYDKWGLLGEKDSPADADNKRYKFLFDHRITYDSKEQSVYKKGMKK